MNFRQSLAHIHLLIQDIGTRIRVDTARLWCMGFSGGARVALNVGALNFGIDAVVLCGAGMPAEDTEEISRLHFIGLAGDADMNYPELYRLNKALNKQGGGNTLITFDGKHEWPPVEEMHSAFIWLQMDYYRRTGLNPPHTVLSKWIARDLSACDSIDNPANRALRYERMIACYSGFTDVFGWKTKKQQIERDPVTIAQRKRMAEIMLAEERAEKNFSEAFIRADLNWWQKQIARLRKTSGGTDVLAGKSAERQMAYIGLAAYSYTNRALSAGRLQDVDKFIRIYRLAEPGNPEHEYLSAVLRARQNRLPEALEFLQEAARLGFSDVQRLVGERDLAPLQTMEGFDGLISSMETNRSQ